MVARLAPATYRSSRATTRLPMAVRAEFAPDAQPDDTARTFLAAKGAALAGGQQFGTALPTYAGGRPPPIVQPPQPTAPGRVPGPLDDPEVAPPPDSLELLPSR